MDPYDPGDLPEAYRARVELILRPRNQLDEQDHYSQTDAKPTIKKGW